jgi:hypothetical protein
VYSSHVSSWPVKNLAELADGSTLYERCQGRGICFALSANPPTLSPYKRLASSLGPENATGQKLTNYPHCCPQHLLTNVVAQQEEGPFNGYEILVAHSGLPEVSNFKWDA